MPNFGVNGKLKYTHTRIFHVRVSLLQFPIKPQICRKWREKCYTKDKLNKCTRRICLIYFSMAPFNDNIKFRLRNLIFLLISE